MQAWGFKHNARTCQNCTLHSGEASRPVSGALQGVKGFQDRRTVASHAPLMAGLSSPLDLRFGPTLSTRSAGLKMGCFNTPDFCWERSKVEPLAGPYEGRGESANAVHFD